MTKNVGEVNGWVVCLGYRQFQEGIKGPAEKQNLIKGLSDRFSCRSNLVLFALLPPTATPINFIINTICNNTNESK